MAAGQYQDFAVSAANKYGVPVDMFLWQIGKESSWNPNARNPKSSATGIAQFTKDTAETFKIDPLDPYASLDAAAKYDAQLYQKWGSWEGALSHYGTLSDADPKTMAAFNESLNKTGSDTGLTWSNLLPSLKKFYDDSMAPLNGSAYTEEEKAGAVKTPMEKWINSGALIVLGIVVIAVAILSNKTVQTAAVTAIKKGK